MSKVPEIEVEISSDELSSNKDIKSVKRDSNKASKHDEESVATSKLWYDDADRPKIIMPADLVEHEFERITSSQT